MFRDPEKRTLDEVWILFLLQLYTYHRSLTVELISRSKRVWHFSKHNITQGCKVWVTVAHVCRKRVFRTPHLSYLSQFQTRYFKYFIEFVTLWKQNISIINTRYLHEEIQIFISTLNCRWSQGAIMSSRIL